MKDTGIARSVDDLGSVDRSSGRNRLGAADEHKALIDSLQYGAQVTHTLLRF